jgi:hypothetical protein
LAIACLCCGPQTQPRPRSPHLITYAHVASFSPTVAMDATTAAIPAIAAMTADQVIAPIPYATRAGVALVPLLFRTSQDLYQVPDVAYFCQGHLLRGALSSPGNAPRRVGGVAYNPLDVLLISVPL